MWLLWLLACDPPPSPSEGSPDSGDPAAPPEIVVGTGVPQLADTYLSERDGLLYLVPKEDGQAPPPGDGPISSDFGAFLRGETVHDPYQVRHELCLGRHDRRAQVLSAVAATYRYAPDQAAEVALLAASCDRPEACEWLRQLIFATPSAAERQWAWTALSTCHDDETDVVFDTAHPPPLAWLSHHDGVVRVTDGVSDAELERWTTEVVTALRSGKLAAPWIETRVSELRSVAGTRVDERLYAVFVDLPRGDARDSLALALADTHWWDVDVVVSSACASQANSWKAACTTGAVAPRLRRLDPDADVAAQLRDPTLSSYLRSLSAALVRVRPGTRPALADALADCAGGTPPAAGYYQYRCLEALAVVDRGRAVALATTLRSDHPLVSTLAASLRATPDLEVARSRLVALGLLAPDASIRPDEVSLLPALAREGHATLLWGSGSTDESAEVLRRIARLGAPALDDLVVAASPSETPALRVWHGGTHYRANIATHGVPDDEAVVAFANALWERAQSPTRAVLSADPQGTWVLVAPAETLRAARGEHLVPDPPDTWAGPLQLAVGGISAEERDTGH